MNTVLVSVNFIITILFPEFRVICMFYSISVLLLCMFLFFLCRVLNTSFRQYLALEKTGRQKSICMSVLLELALSFP